MPIATGDQLPDVPVLVIRDGKPAEVGTRELLGSGTVVLFAVPAAFSPGCTQRHLPTYVEHASELAGKGVDLVACIAVNDIYVMDAWGKAYDVTGTITMVADPDASFTDTIGLGVDIPRNGLGHRSQRYAMVLRDGVVTDLLLEDNGLSVGNSTATCVLDVL